jgi:hypothetical protein
MLRGLWIILLVEAIAIVLILRSNPASSARKIAFAALWAGPVLGLIVAAVDYLRRRRVRRAGRRPHYAQPRLLPPTPAPARVQAQTGSAVGGAPRRAARPREG